MNQSIRREEAGADVCVEEDAWVDTLDSVAEGHDVLLSPILVVDGHNGDERNLHVSEEGSKESLHSSYLLLVLLHHLDHVVHTNAAPCIDGQLDNVVAAQH